MAHEIAGGDRRSANDPQEYPEECLHGFDRCRTEAEFAAWAKRWGRPLINALIELNGVG